MYAVIKAGGKQHRVKSGDVIEVELVHGQPGDAVEFHPLLVVDDDGKAHHGKDVARALVVGRLVGEQKGDKVKVFKYRPKTGYSRRQGHRQLMTLLEIEDVRLETRKAASKKAEEKPTAEAGQAEGAEEAPKPAAKRQTAKATAAKTPGPRRPRGWWASGRPGAAASPWSPRPSSVPARQPRARRTASSMAPRHSLTWMRFAEFSRIRKPMFSLRWRRRFRVMGSA